MLRFARSSAPFELFPRSYTLEIESGSRATSFSKNSRPSIIARWKADSNLSFSHAFFFLLFFNGRSAPINEQMPIGGNITHRCNVKRFLVEGSRIIFHYANLISFKEDSQTISYVEAILTGISNIIGLTDWGHGELFKLDEQSEICTVNDVFFLKKNLF